MRALDLTRGPIAKGIALFALPLLGTSVVQQLYSTVDLLFVGNVLGTDATAALGLGSLLITLLAGLFTGVSVGINVRVGSLFGAGDEGLGRALASSLSLGIACGAVLALAGQALAEPFLQWMSVPTQSAADALVYLRFGVAVALPMAVYNACAGALRGLGDSRSPLIAQLVGGLGNIAFNWLALCVLGWGIAGCAFATLAANLLAAVIAAVLLVRSEAYRARERRGFSIDGPTARFILRFGLPIGGQTVAIVLSNIYVQYQVDLLGVASVAAFVVYLKVELPIYYVILALGQAATTFVAQNNGAGEEERCKRGARVCQVMCLVAAAALSAIMLAVGSWAFWLFDRSAEVIAIGTAFIWVTFPFYFVYAVLEVQADAMRGYGHSLGPALAVLANNCVLRIVLVTAFSAQGWGMAGIAASYPVTWTTAALCMVALRLLYSRREKR